VPKVHQGWGKTAPPLFYYPFNFFFMPTPLEKLIRFTQNPCGKLLLSLLEFNSLSPFQQGYACYFQASWPESPIVDTNPYKPDSDASKLFNAGCFAAMQEVQEIDS
jgi:hypothetical protein